MEQVLKLAKGSKFSRLLSSFFRRLARATATLKLTNGMIQRLLLEVERITLTTTDSIRLGRTAPRLNSRFPTKHLLPNKMATAFCVEIILTSAGLGKSKHAQHKLQGT